MVSGDGIMMPLIMVPGTDHSKVAFSALLV
jgi:hypothetical protein